MQIYRWQFDMRLPSPPALAIGNFDGVHTGHQAVIQALRNMANDKNLTPVLMSFFPHPRTVITGVTPPLITTLRDRAYFLEQYGIHHWILLPFTERLRCCSADRFVRDYLYQRLNIKQLLIGDDFRFGYRGSGDFALLERLSGQYGYAVGAIQSICTTNGIRISSSAVRKAVAEHDLEKARALLGHALTLTGRVHHGKKRGREMATPTANIHVPQQWCLPNGVYVVKIQVLPDTSFHWGIANLGVAPTFQGQRRKLEVHSFEPTGNIYGRMLRVEMITFIRTEQQFESQTALQKQIQRDIGKAHAYISDFNN